MSLAIDLRPVFEMASEIFFFDINLINRQLAVALFNPQTQKGDRVGFKTLEDGRKVRIFKSNGEVVDA